MKKLLFWCVFVLSCFGVSFADSIDLSKKSSVVIVLKHKVDPNNGKRTMDMEIEDPAIKKGDIKTGTVFDVNGRIGANYRFRIEDFNTLKYSVKEVSKASEEEKFKLPPIFAGAFSGLVANLDDLEKGTATAKEKKTEQNKSISTRLQMFPGEETEIDILDKALRILREFDPCAVKVSEFMKKIEAIREISIEIESYELFQMELAKLLGPGWNNPDTISYLINEQRKCIVKMRDCTREISDLLDQNNDSLLLKYMKYSLVQISDKATEFGDKLDKIKETLKQYATDGQKQFIYVSETPIEFTGGKLDITLKISNKADDKKDASVYQLDFEISSVSKNFLDASTGVFICNLYDNSYNLVKEDDGNHIVGRGAKDQLRAQFGAMIHYGWVLSDDFSIAISLGLALANSKFQFYLGPSIALSQKRNIYISAGAVLGSVKRLKGYDVNDLFTGQAKDIPTDDFYCLGGFLGLSYKF